MGLISDIMKRNYEQQAERQNLKRELEAGETISKALEDLPGVPEEIIEGLRTGSLTINEAVKGISAQRDILESATKTPIELKGEVIERIQSGEAVSKEEKRAVGITVPTKKKITAKDLEILSAIEQAGIPRSKVGAFVDAITFFPTQFERAQEKIKGLTPEIKKAFQEQFGTGIGKETTPKVEKTKGSLEERRLKRAKELRKEFPDLGKKEIIKKVNLEIL